jgi:hypothetical protein
MLSSFIINVPWMKIFNDKVFMSYKHLEIAHGNQNVLGNVIISQFLVDFVFLYRIHYSPKISCKISPIVLHF